MSKLLGTKAISILVLLFVVSSGEKAEKAYINPNTLFDGSEMTITGAVGHWKSQSRSSLFSMESGRLQMKTSSDEHTNKSWFLFSDPAGLQILYVFQASVNKSVPFNETNDCSLVISRPNTEPIHTQGTVEIHVSKANIICTLSASHFNLSLSLAAELQSDEDLQEPIVSYSFIISCVSVALIFAYSKHAQDCILSETSARKSSIDFLRLQSAIDLWLSIWHLYLATVYSRAFDYMMLASFMSFAVYLVIHGRLMMNVWKAQNPEHAQHGLDVFRIRFSLFEGTSVVFITSCVPVFIVLSRYKVYVIMAVHSYLPLILFSARKGYKNCIKPSVIWVVTIARLMLLLYLFGFNHQFMDSPADYEACTMFVFYFAAQLGVVLVQNKYPRFFLPRLCRPKSYSYFRDENEEKLQENRECIICMTGLNLSGHDNSEVINFSRTMHTPCKHLFHEDCLINWMAVKMECPTCRTPLPFIEE
jgi:transmembrane E3 ubiquitin-protein ligase